MKRKLLRLTLLLAIFTFVAMQVNAQSVPNDEIWYTSDGSKIITPNNEDAFGAVIISNKYSNGKGVIKFDSSVKSIDEQAFMDCSVLTSITLPNSVSFIGYEAFAGCNLLASITIPNSVTRIGASAFEQCYSLASITIPNSVTSIGESAFEQCYSLASITIPNSVTSIGESAFANCHKLQSIEIPNSVTSLASHTFASCRALPSIKIPNSVTSIGEFTFLHCTSLQRIEIPNSVTSIGQFAFQDCKRLASIEIPNSVTSIDHGAFRDCTALTRINVDAENPETIKLHEDPFEEGVDVSKCVLSVPDGSLELYRQARVWKNFVNIKEKGIEYNEIRYTSIDGKVVNPCVATNFNAKIVSNAYNDGVGVITFDGDLTEIGTMAFYGCTTLKSVRLPNSVKTIKSNAFGGCTGLSEIQIPYPVTTVDAGAFQNCTGVERIKISSSVKSIGIGAFAGCSTVSEIKVAEGNLVYNLKAPSDCNAIIENDTRTLIYGCKSTTIPFTVAAIGASAFKGCSNLLSISIPESVEKIGMSAFNGCSGLKSIRMMNTNPVQLSEDDAVFSGVDMNSCVLYVPEGSVEQYRNADVWKYFANIWKFSPANNEIWYTSTDRKVVTPMVATNFNVRIVSNEYNNDRGVITFDGDLTEIGTVAFYGRTALTSVTLPETVTTIGNNAFGGCNGLTEFNIPKSVTTLGPTAFQNCSGLKSIRIPSSVTSIGYAAFSGCSGIESIKVVPENTVYNSASNCNAIIETATNTLVLGCQNTIIPASVTTIGQSAFSGCSSMKGIVIPESVTKICMSAFYKCTGLMEITVNNQNPIPLAEDSIAFYGVDMNSCVLYVPKGSLEKYRNADVWNDFVNIKEMIQASNEIWYTSINGEIVEPQYKDAFGANIISNEYINGRGVIKFESEVTKIGEEAFYSKRELSSITIPNSVKSIGDNAFAFCEDLTNIDFPNSVTTIGEASFSRCSSLTSIDIPNSVTTIESAAFERCFALESIKINAKNPRTIQLSSEGDVFNYVDKSKCILSVPKGSVEKYRNADVWKDFANIEEYGPENNEIYYTSSDDKVVTPMVANFNVKIVSNENVNGHGVITFDGDLTEIGTMAFYGRTALTSVTLPETVTTIGNNAFGGCTGLSEVAMPKSVTTIGGGAFQNCKASRSIAIPEAVTSIGYAAFSGCSSVTSIEVDAENKVYNSASGCNAIIETATNTLVLGCQNTIIPASVTTIGQSAFSGCSSMKGIVIPESVTKICMSAFYNCTGFKEIIVMTPNPTPLAEDSIAFYGVDMNSCVLYVPEGTVEKYRNAEVWKNFVNIKEDVHGNNEILYTSTDGKIVVPYNDYAFGSKIISNEYAARGVIIFEFPVTSIGSTAFQGCNKLQSIEIPNSVTTIGEASFEGCSALTSIEIPNSVTTIGEASFEGCSALTSIEIPNSVTTIGEASFAYCSALTSIEIPNSVTSIGESAFYDCNKLQSIEIPNSVTSLASHTFAYCEALPSIKIPNSVTWIGGYAFAYCISLTSIEIPNSVTSIGESAFYDCFKLQSIEIPNSVTEIGESTFENCYSLTSITIPNSVTSIGRTTFQGCSALTSIEIPNSVTSIGENAFYDCNKLQSIEIPNSVTWIGGWAFTKCTSLTSIEIPNSVTTIGEGSFAYCSALTSIKVYVENPESIELGENVFYGVDKTSCVLYVPKGSAEKYRNAEVWKDFVNIQEFETYKKGDVNADDAVDVADITALASVILGKTIEVDEARCDVNEDGSVDVADITAVAIIILNNAKEEEDLEE